VGGLKGGGCTVSLRKSFLLKKKKKGAEGAAEKKTLKNKQKPSCSLIVLIESKEIATKKRRFQKMQRI
jgi:hypothetical protein